MAVQNPLDTLENDVAFTDRAIADAEGPVVLVGHSYGGAVITQAGVNPKVHSLVYVAAYAPEVGQSVLDTQKPYPDAPGRPFIVKDDAGYLKFTDEGIFHYFAPDLPSRRTGTDRSDTGRVWRQGDLDPPDPGRVAHRSLVRGRLDR